MSLRDTLLSAFSTAPVAFTTGGQSMFLRPLTTADILDAKSWSKESNKNGYLLMFVRSVCDDQGERQFKDDETGIIETLAGGFVDAVVTRIFELSGLGGASEKKA
jgi:hypothetical protein